MIAGRARSGLFVLTVSTALGFIASTPPLLSRQTNSMCSSDRDCKIPHTECYKKSLCQCKSDYIAKKINNTSFYCVPTAQELGDPCEDDMQCEIAFGQNSGCIHGQCDCRPNSHYVHGLCYKSLRIGDICRVSDDCYVESTDIVSYCDSGRCICPPGYRPNAKRTDCIRVVGIGGPCLINDDCAVLNSRCLQECVCQPGYVEDEKGQHCLPVANELGRPCTETIQCTENLRNAHCDSTTQTCVCDSGNHVKHGRCLKTAKLHEPCLERDECVIPSKNDTAVNCTGGFCLCSENFERKGEDCARKPKAILPNSAYKWREPTVPLLLLQAYIATITFN